MQILPKIKQKIHLSTMLLMTAVIALVVIGIPGSPLSQSAFALHMRYETDPSTGKDVAIVLGVSYPVAGSCDLSALYYNCLIGADTLTDRATQDTDFDSLENSFEVNVINTDPTKKDTDGDGALDGEELILLLGHPDDPDSDNDGLNDLQEYQTGRANSPFNDDSDGDGLGDGEEVLGWGTLPDKRDTDSDGLNDYSEIIEVGSNATNPDTDGDGVKDGKDPDPLDMFVVPEFPIGGITAIGSSLAALGGYVAFKKRSRLHKETGSS